MHEIREGDCREVMAQMEPESVDAIVCDPPYGLSFMGKGWDHGVPGEEFWIEALRVAKPGTHLIAFGGTRTFHRLTCAIEDAGWEIRDCLSWLYGSGFPKSLDVGKAIDRRRDDTEQIYRVTAWIREARNAAGLSNRDINEAFGFAGMMAGHWTTAKSQPSVPTLDQVPKLLALLGVDDPPEEIGRLLLDLNGRKGQPGENWWKREKVGVKSAGIAVPGEGVRHTVGGSRAVEVPITTPTTEAARQWHGWGTALKPAWEPAILARKPLIGTVAANVLEHGTGAVNVDGCRVGAEVTTTVRSGNSGAHGRYGKDDRVFTRENPPGRWPANVMHDGEAGLGEWSRYFYCAKASKRDRGEGNSHPTVKPNALMRYMVRLVTPPGGIVLDPFCGSGSTIVAAQDEGFDAIGIEQDPAYVEIARGRIKSPAGALFQ
jgi:DNA modification methylase